jgi:hypothetical protein
LAIFTSSDQLYDVFVGFMEDMAADPVLGPKFVKSKTIFRINYADPEASILIDCTHDPIHVTQGPSDVKPDVELTMSADNGHLFWIGKLKITTAITKRKVKVNGQVTGLRAVPDVPRREGLFKSRRPVRQRLHTIADAANTASRHQILEVHPGEH